jgi:hypothetical protein
MFDFLAIRLAPEVKVKDANLAFTSFIFGNYKTLLKINFYGTNKLVTVKVRNVGYKCIYRESLVVPLSSTHSLAQQERISVLSLQS